MTKAEERFVEAKRRLLAVVIELEEAEKSPILSFDELTTLIFFATKDLQFFIERTDKEGVLNEKLQDMDEKGEEVCPSNDFNQSS